MGYRILYVNVVLAALLAMLGIGPVMAAPPQKTVAVSASHRNGSPSSDDKKFMSEAAQGNMAEISLGQLAQKKGTADVQKAGARMVADHTKMLNQLQALATSQAVKLPTSPSVSQKAMHGTLSILSGKLFDKAYVDEMVKDHNGDIQAFQKEADTTHDAGLKSLVNGALPIMRQHLTLFNQLKAKK